MAMAYEYVVVEFTEEGSVEVVHKSWIESEDEGMFCYWPRKNCQQRAKKGEIPDKAIWKRYPVRIFSYTADYDKALERRTRAMDSSNVETNEDEVHVHVARPNREVRPPRRIYSDSEEEDFRPARPPHVERRTTPHNERRTTPSAPARPPTPPAYHISTPSSSAYLNSRPSSSLSNFSFHSGERERSRSPVRCPRPLPDLNYTTSTPRRPHVKCALDEVIWCGYLVLVLAKMEKTQAEHTQLLRRISAGQPATTVYADTDLDELIPSPIQEEAELERFSINLLDLDFSKKLIHFLGALGGTNIGDTVQKNLQESRWERYLVRV